MRVDELEKERDRWVEAVDDSEIRRLASSFRRGDECTIFQPRKRGGFNVCFFVEFDSPKERWAVRIPIPSWTAESVMDEKTEIELATMRYVSAKTSIPIPKVHAYAFSNAGFHGLPFIIMDYVESRSLKDLGYPLGDTWGGFLDCAPQTPAAKHVFQQLAGIYMQLRQLEFPRIGALGLPSRDTPAFSCDPEEIRVCHRPLSIDMSLQELDGLEPAAIFPPKRPLSTAEEYVDGLLRLADNAFEKEADQNMDEDDPAYVLYAAHHFRRFVQDEWLDRSANEGPFVLSMFAV
jgi:hypothetical protein